MRSIYLSFWLSVIFSTCVMSSTCSWDSTEEQDFPYPMGTILDTDNHPHTYLSNNDMVRIEGYNLNGLVSKLASLHPTITYMFLNLSTPLTLMDVKHLSLFKNLRHLKLMNCGITNELAIHLMQNENMSNLVTLDFSYNSIDDDGVLQILEAGKSLNLKRLCIWNGNLGNKLSDVVLKAICASELGKKLHLLCISCPKTGMVLSGSLKRVEYNKFYIQKAFDNDIYLLDRPSEIRVKWIRFKDLWFLVDESYPSASASDASPRDEDETQFILDGIDKNVSLSSNDSRLGFYAVTDDSFSKEFSFSASEDDAHEE